MKFYYKPQNFPIDLCLEFKFWEWKSIKGMKKGHWEMQTHPGLITLSLAEILSLTNFLVLRSVKCH